MQLQQAFRAVLLTLGAQHPLTDSEGEGRQSWEANHIFQKELATIGSLYMRWPKLAPIWRKLEKLSWVNHFATKSNHFNDGVATCKLGVFSTLGGATVV